MYRKISDFISDWEAESQATLRMFQSIPEDKKSKRLNENVRALDRLAWHITQTIPEMGAKAGLFDSDNLEHQSVPGSVEAIIEEYAQQSQEFKHAVQERWKDSELEDKVNMYGFQWEKGKILSIFILHQTHHRGQMTVLLRSVGATVPGIYGPAKEEWTKYGMPVMD